MSRVRTRSCVQLLRSGRIGDERPEPSRVLVGSEAASVDASVLPRLIEPPPIR